MQVDQSGRHQLAAGVKHAQRARRRNVGFDRLDRAVANADVAPTAQRLTGVEHIGVLDHKVELVVGRHGGARRAGERGGERERTGTAQKFAT